MVRSAAKTLFPYLVAIASASCIRDAAVAPSSATDELAIDHVTVLAMTEHAVAMPDSTVVVRSGRIASIGPTTNASSLSPGARRVDGTGKWLMPALADCHVHIANDRMVGLVLQAPITTPLDTGGSLLPYVANGVLQVINMSAMSESIAQRNEVEHGTVLGPHIALAAMVDGSTPIWPVGMTRVAASPTEGRDAVRAIKAEGYDFVKTYSMLAPETFIAMVDEARAQHIRVVGHIPGRGTGRTDELLRPGFSMIAHAEELAFQSNDRSDADIAHYVDLARTNHIALTATLTLDERILEMVRDPGALDRRPELAFQHPAIRTVWLHRNPYASAPDHFTGFEQVIDFNRRLVLAFVRAGIPVLAGTDSLVPGVPPGFALHDELVALARAGMSNEQVLASATRVPAEWLGVADDRGTVEVGKRADLLLLDSDPLANVANTRAIAAVIVGGRYLSRAELDSRMAALSSRYRAMPVQPVP